jgi:crotonobetainyl-CoA:carnitine CoA-transferase CaiB-like acyl-CoA transferase
VPNAAVTDIDDLPDLVEQTSPGYLLREVHPEVGEVLHPRPAVTFDEVVSVRPAPGLGEHTDEIKAELG